MQSFLNILLILVTLLAVSRILLISGVFERAGGIKDAKKELKNRQRLEKQMKSDRFLCRLYEGICYIGGSVALSDTRREQYKFYISRLDLRIESLGRNYTPEELRGSELILPLIGVAFIPLGVVWSPMLIVTLITLIFFTTSSMQHASKVEKEDKILDEHFIDLYLMLHSKLKQGSNARLAKTVEAYMNTLDVAEDVKVAEVMKRFCKYFLNNLSLYPDSDAVVRLRDRYTSATIVNFCNSASQALQGIDNSEVLYSTRNNLLRKKEERFRKIADKRSAQASRAILLVFINLFIFVVLSFSDKIPSNLGSIFGGF